MLALDLRLVVALALASVLAASGSLKLAGIGEFRGVLAGTYGIGAPWIRFVAFGVPAIELACAALLLVPAFQWLAFVTGATTFAVFGVVASVAIVRGKTGDCGCLGTVRHTPLSRATAVRAFALASVAAVGALATSAAPSVVRPSSWFLLLLDFAGLLVLGTLGLSIVRLRVALGASRGSVRD